MNDTIRLLLVLAGLFVAFLLWRRDRRLSAAFVPPRPRAWTEAERNALTNGIEAARGAYMPDPERVAERLDAEATRADRGEISLSEHLAFLQGFGTELGAQNDDLLRDQMSDQERKDRQVALNEAFGCLEQHRAAASRTRPK